MPFGTLERPRLLRRIQEALRSHHLLITAPAGYGKSVLLRSLLARRPDSHYLLLTPADADLTYFQARTEPLLATAATIILDDVHHLDDLLTTLEQWEPLLPELPYEDWLLPARERLRTLYVDGCLYAARTLLMRGRHAEAAGWAERAVERASWLEEAYQLLMRAHARRGRRGRALKIFDDAVAALDRELAVEPSELTRWLVQRLRAGESI